MKKSFTLITFLAIYTLCVASLFIGNSFAGNQSDDDFSYSSFSKIPLLHEGRVKPIDTFARAFLTNVYGRDSINGISASAWLAELIFDPKKAYKKNVFNVPNPDTLNAIGLEWRKGHRYSFSELSKAIDSNVKMINTLYSTPPNERTLSQGSLVDLYIKAIMYSDLSRSISLVLPLFEIKNEELAKELELPFNESFTYFEMIQKKPLLNDAVDNIKKKSDNSEKLTKKEREQIRLLYSLKKFDSDKASQSLRIIPPQWEANKDVWVSPWAVLEEGRGSPKSAAYIDLWKKLAFAYKQRNTSGWNDISENLQKYAYDIAGKNASSSIQKLEVMYNKANLFQNSLAMYIFSFILFIASALFWRKPLRKISFYVLSIGCTMHAVGMIIRMVIMNRPPVATLYESIIFVSLIGVIFALFLEWKRKDGIGLMIGSLLGAILQFVGTRYAAEGDTMGMLAAVLDTNFWLATHVVTITIGYGCCFVAGTLGHVYVVQKWLYPSDDESLQSTRKNILGVALVALFFSILGTILGGIWADQSWGRFWGWDPKENGAMLIVLWLTWIIHGRIAGIVSDLSFAMGMVLTNIVVALAWFGVNLLNVGLHSYGFAANTATSLSIFCGAELLFVIMMYLLICGNSRNVRES